MYFPLKVSIPEPCHEDWGKMNPVDINQRHCQSCEKTVTDFTNMSDVQIGNHLRKGGNLCGRFRASQLDRRIAIGGPRRFSGLRAAAAASGLLLSLPAAAQTLQVPPPTHQVEAKEQGGIKTNTTSQASSPLQKGNITVSGQVADSYGETLIGASILLQGTSIGTVTDIDGQFTIDLPSDSAVTLVLSYTGFATETVLISAEEIQKARSEAQGQITLAPLLEESGPIFSGDLIIHYHRPSLIDNLMVHTVKPIYVGISHAGQVKYGDWKDYWREKFAKAKARRTERRNDRALRRAARKLASSINSPKPSVFPVPSTSITTAEVDLRLEASPNPFTDHLRVSFMLPTEQDYTLELTSVTGQIVAKKTGKGIGGLQQVELRKKNASTLLSGTYFLRLQTEDGLFSVTTLVH